MVRGLRSLLLGSQSSSKSKGGLFIVGLNCLISGIKQNPCTCVNMEPFVLSAVFLQSCSIFFRVEIGCCPFSQRAPNKPEFPQLRLSGVKGRSSPARGYKFGCVCSYMATHFPSILMTGHIGTNTPNSYPLAGDDRPLTLLKRGCANSDGFGAR